ncbi:hypothetical protein SHDE107825_16350 [Shewanella denitrificans]
MGATIKFYAQSINMLIADRNGNSDANGRVLG